MDTFVFEPAEGFLNETSFPNPSNETETRTQLQALHSQTRDYINSIVTVMQGGGVAQLRINNENILQYSTDGGQTWGSLTVSGGHLYYDSNLDLYDYSRIIFANCTMTPSTIGGDSYLTISLQGEQGQAGQGVPTGGNAGQFLVKVSSSDYDTAWESLPNNSTSLTLASTGWVATADASSYTGTVYVYTASVTGMTSSAVPKLSYSDSTADSPTDRKNRKKAFEYIAKIESANGSVTITAHTLPTVDINVKIWGY